MEQIPSNAPVNLGGSSSSLFQTWIKALTKPSEQTYVEIANSPDAKATTAYLWVFLSSLVASFFSLIVQGAVIRGQLAQSGVGGDQFGSGMVGVALTLLCGAPIAAALGTIFFAIGVALVQWIAKMFGGTGTNDQLAYAVAAFSVPYSFVSGIFILLSAIPYVGFCFQLILSLAGFYIIFLEITAVKAVNKLGWGPAAGSVLLPAAAILFVCGCLMVASLMLMGPMMGDAFNGFQFAP